MVMGKVVADFAGLSVDRSLSRLGVVSDRQLMPSAARQGICY